MTPLTPDVLVEQVVKKVNFFLLAITINVALYVFLGFQNAANTSKYVLYIPVLLPHPKSGSNAQFVIN